MKVLDRDGIVAVGEPLRDRDVLINKHSPVRKEGDETTIATNLRYKGTYWRQWCACLGQCSACTVLNCLQCSTALGRGALLLCLMTGDLVGTRGKDAYCDQVMMASNTEESMLLKVRSFASAVSTWSHQHA
jgi:hypothetical protein